jgi:hypothetical protein
MHPSAVLLVLALIGLRGATAAQPPGPMPTGTAAALPDRRVLATPTPGPPSPPPAGAPLAPGPAPTAFPGLPTPTIRSPLNLRVVSVGPAPGTVTLAWDPPANETVLEYQILAVGAGNETTPLFRVPGSVGQTVLSGLHPAIGYSLVVVAVDTQGRQSAPSNPAQTAGAPTATLVPPPPPPPGPGGPQGYGGLPGPGLGPLPPVPTLTPLPFLPSSPPAPLLPPPLPSGAPAGPQTILPPGNVGPGLLPAPTAFLPPPRTRCPVPGGQCPGAP